ncbi:transglycosylase SLT domain-containing protein [Streptomyces sp. B6B3]|uniref:transglycosylase SLT domain-containing protein n=1 Tax=Streptomyces sp. B6B3 TaxID=3153570 RepID=UPI00325D44E5
MPTQVLTRLNRSTRTRGTAAAALATAGTAAMVLGLATVPADAQEVTPSPAPHADAVAWDIKADDLPGQRLPDGLGPETGVPTQGDDHGGGRGGDHGGDRGADRGGDAGPHVRSPEDGRGDHTRPERTPNTGDPRPARTSALDRWIDRALEIMDEKGIPGTYEGLHRNIMRESSGDPNIMNDWDINAKNGVPSIGLLQVIQPTFDAYHVPGTPDDIYNPVSNITAAANYAADRYGTIDNVDSAY